MENPPAVIATDAGSSWTKMEWLCVSTSSGQKAAWADAVGHGTVALAVENPSMERLTALAELMLIRI
jgi:hypothetical protein